MKKPKAAEKAHLGSGPHWKQNHTREQEARVKFSASGYSLMGPCNRASWQRTGTTLWGRGLGGNCTVKEIIIPSTS